MSSRLRFLRPGLKVGLDGALGRYAAVARDQRKLGE